MGRLFTNMSMGALITVWLLLFSFIMSIAEAAPKKSLYDILGVQPDVTVAELRKTYRKLAMKVSYKTDKTTKLNLTTNFSHIPIKT